MLVERFRFDIPHAQTHISGLHLHTAPPPFSIFLCRLTCSILRCSAGRRTPHAIHFPCYCVVLPIPMQVPRIAELRETVTGIKNELVEQTSQAFNQVGQLASSTADPEGFERDADKPGQFRSLQEACLVVDALGGQARQQQVAPLHFCLRGCSSASVSPVEHPPSAL